MVKYVRLTGWVSRMLTRNPENLLALLLEAHQKDQSRADISMAFRAGVKVGRKYPAVARDLLGEPEWSI